jgi:serine phosphatase RsbU (regulator of sigma subunit)/CBS domain-containing protein
MDHVHHIIPAVSEITNPAPEISADTLVRDVMELFQKDPSLLALPITADGRFSGVINRKTLFFEHLGRPFAVDLYGKKPIRVLLDKDSFSVEPELDITAALTRLLAVDPSLAMDSFPVVHGDACLGIVSVSDLMMKISESQSLLLETLQHLSARISEEVAKASVIQRELLPPSEHRFGQLLISAELITSSEIGGDFYDYFPLDKGRVGLVVGDVSGHGVQAGMVTTAAKASLHTLIAQGVTTPAALLYGMNNSILTTARQTLLMTCVVAIIDCTAATVTIANAGHNFPYLYRKASLTPERIEEVANFPLGFEQNCSYQEWTTAFQPGDALLLYTDGIVECTGPAGDDFGYERLENILGRSGDISPTELRRLLRSSAETFTGSSSFADDVTLLIAASSA